MIGVRSKKSLLLAAMVLVGVAGGGYLSVRSRSVPKEQAELVYLDEKNVGTLRAEFNAGAGGTRVLVLLSPT